MSDRIQTECANCSFRTHLFGVVCWPGVWVLIGVPTVIFAVWILADG